jgi:hypothetical protein
MIYKQDHDPKHEYVCHKTKSEKKWFWEKAWAAFHKCL